MIPVQNIGCYDVAPNERQLHIDGPRFPPLLAQLYVFLPPIQTLPSFLLPCNAIISMAAEKAWPAMKSYTNSPKYRHNAFCYFDSIIRII